MGNNQEWSVIGQQLFQNGTELYCGNCQFKLYGQRYCPNCGAKIKYVGETDDNTYTVSTSSTLDKVASVSNSMQKTGDAMSKAGSGLIFGCTIPVLLIIIILLLL